MLDAKWVHALARRLLRHRNPAARKAFLQRLLDHAAPAEVADWPLVRDAVLPALDDNELRKSRDVARRCDVAAVDFVARFYRAAPEETRAAVVALTISCESCSRSGSHASRHCRSYWVATTAGRSASRLAFSSVARASCIARTAASGWPASSGAMWLQSTTQEKCSQ